MHNMPCDTLSLSDSRAVKLDLNFGFHECINSFFNFISSVVLLGKPFSFYNCNFI